MTIYIDADFKCHTEGSGSMTAVETDFFDDKCADYIEGYRYIPAGCQWSRSDGVVFRGEMIAPWKPWKALDKAQREYERQRAAEMAAENEALLSDMAQLVEEVYQSDLEMMTE